MGSLKPGARYIYEQQDGVIYAREEGTDARFEVGGEWRPNHRSLSVWDQDYWQSVLVAAKDHPQLHAAIEHVKMLYEQIRHER